VALLFVALAIVDTHGAEVDTWIGRLVEDDPFSREEAAAEIRRLGPDALEPLARALESETLELRLRADRLFRETAAGFLIELENEYRALELDRRERDHLEERAKLREELVELRDRVARWKEDHPDLDAAVETYLTWKAFDTRKRALPEGESLSAEDEAKLGELEPQVRALETRIEELAQKSDLVARYYRLELQGDMLADPKEVEALRLAHLRERIAAGEPTVDSLLGRARRIGAPLWAVIAARRSSLPLRAVSILGDLRSPVLALYDRLIDEAREGAPAVWQDPPAEVFDRDRYFLSWYWEAELAARSSRMEKAQALLDRHIDATIADLEAPALLLRERAEIELYRMRKLGWSRLAERIGIEDVTRLTGGERSPHAFLACLLRWRISPEVYARVNLHFGDYKGLGFPARRRKIFQFARAAGQDAIPTLRAIVVDDELEQSFLVKYAAAKALAFQLGDQLGYVVLKSLHPNLVVKQPEIARALWSRIPPEMALRAALLARDVDPSHVRREDMLPYLKHMTHVDFAMFLKMLRAAGDHSAEDWLGEIDVPVLIVAGEKDTFTPASLSEAMAERIPNAELLMVSGGSHVAPIEQPELVGARIRAFVERVAST